MGLDSHLYYETYITESSFPLLTKNIYDQLNIPSGKQGEKLLIKAEIAYWRKANHIHGWFVDNVQDGIDNQEYYQVNREQLKELLDICKKILEDHSLAPKLLPRREGFFFGNQTYNDAYFNSIKNTVEQLEKIFEQVGEEDFATFEYNGNW